MTLSTCAQAAVMASFCVTIWLRTPTNLRPRIRTAITITAITTHDFIDSSLLLQRVHGLDDGSDSLQIARQVRRGIELARIDPLLPQIQQQLERLRVEPEGAARLRDHFPLLHGCVRADKMQRVPEQDAER